MRDRTLGVIFTVLVVFLFGIPGVACMCLGLSSFLFSAGLNGQGISYGWTTAFGAFGLCIGFFLVLITIVISYLLLHRKPETPAMVPVAPIQPISTEKPTPPTNPDDPLPPTI
jgi:TRAP-type C4-dicarboxylate transport system permease small subunit